MKTTLSGKSRRKYGGSLGESGVGRVFLCISRREQRQPVSVTSPKSVWIGEGDRETQSLTEHVNSFSRSSRPVFALSAMANDCAVTLLL